MNRKLHNSLIATVASASLLILGLLAATPVQPDFPPPSLVTAVAAQDELQAADQADAPTASPARDTHPETRQRRHSLRMPFFSFAPRG